MNSRDIRDARERQHREEQKLRSDLAAMLPRRLHVIAARMSAAAARKFAELTRSEPPVMPEDLENDAPPRRPFVLREAIPPVPSDWTRPSDLAAERKGPTASAEQSRVPSTARTNHLASGTWTDGNEVLSGPLVPVNQLERVPEGAQCVSTTRHASGSVTSMWSLNAADRSTATYEATVSGDCAPVPVQAGTRLFSAVNTPDGARVTNTMEYTSNEGHATVTVAGSNEVRHIVPDGFGRGGGRGPDSPEPQPQGPQGPVAGATRETTTHSPGPSTTVVSVGPDVSTRGGTKVSAVGCGQVDGVGFVGLGVSYETNGSASRGLGESTGVGRGGDGASLQSPTGMGPSLSPGPSLSREISRPTPDQH